MPFKVRRWIMQILLVVLRWFPLLLWLHLCLLHLQNQKIIGSFQCRYTIRKDQHQHIFPFLYLPKTQVIMSFQCQGIIQYQCPNLLYPTHQRKQERISTFAIDFLSFFFNSWLLILFRFDRTTVREQGHLYLAAAISNIPVMWFQKKKKVINVVCLLDVCYIVCLRK